MRRNQIAITIIMCALTCATVPFLQAQETPPGCVQWKTYTDTVWVEQDITENRLVSETTYETKEVTKSRPRWISEQRERIVTEEKPVEQTSERVVTRTVRKPITTTKTRIKTRVEESWEDVTEMRDETYTVRKPVTERVIEKKEVLVRKPVTRRSVEKEAVTVYKPQQSSQTTYVPGTLLVPGQTSSRPRMRWLQRGYYSDPYSGQPVWRRSGLHWVDQPTYGQNAVPVVVPQQQSSITLVPETVVKEKPVESTVYVDEYETRDVPVEVERMVEETRTRRVPYTVRIPKRKVIEEEVPYTETTYVDETITERIPYTETVMKKVTRTEPYTQIRESWEDYTETVRVPKTTSRRVPYVSRYRVPYLVEVRVPCDASGRPVARGQQVKGTHRLHPAWRNMITKVEGGKVTATKELSETAASSVLEKSQPAVFDVPEKAPMPDASSILGEAPTNLRFPTRMETTTRMKPVLRASQAPEKQEPEVTEATKTLADRIESRFRDIGMQPVKRATETKPVVETSQPEETTKTVVQKPAQVEFQPEALSVDVEVPASAQPPEGSGTEVDVNDSDDDTIEREDVDLSRPDRS